MTLFGKTEAFSEKESADLCWKIMEMNVIPMAAFEGELFLVGNQAFLDLIGYTEEDLEDGKINWKEITPEEYREKDESCIKELEYQTIPTPYEKEYIRKDGSRVKFTHHNCTVSLSSLKGVTILVPTSGISGSPSCGYTPKTPS